MKENNRDITADDRPLTASGETGAAEAGSQAQEPKKRTSPAVIVILVLIIAGAGYWYSQYTKVTPPEMRIERLLSMASPAALR